MCEWKIIEKYPNYEASDDGQVREIVSGRVLSTKNKNNNRYKRNSVPLKVGKKFINVSVSRCVALAWIPNPNNLPVVNHKNGNVRNDCVWNLEWCTQAQNVRHAIEELSPRQKSKKRELE